MCDLSVDGEAHLLFRAQILLWLGESVNSNVCQVRCRRTGCAAVMFTGWRYI
jgi:hypothetical protein